MIRQLRRLGAAAAIATALATVLISDPAAATPTVVASCQAGQGTAYAAPYGNGTQWHVHADAVYTGCVGMAGTTATVTYDALASGINCSTTSASGISIGSPSQATITSGGLTALVENNNVAGTSSSTVRWTGRIPNDPSTGNPMPNNVVEANYTVGFSGCVNSVLTLSLTLNSPFTVTIL